MNSREFAEKSQRVCREFAEKRNSDMIDRQKVQEKAQAARQEHERKQAAERSTTGWRPSHAVLMATVKATDGQELARWYPGKFKRACRQFSSWIKRRRQPSKAFTTNLGPLGAFIDSDLTQAIIDLVQALDANSWLQLDDDPRKKDIRDGIFQIYCQATRISINPPLSLPQVADTT
jgi:hypothetical protein